MFIVQFWAWEHLPWIAPKVDPDKEWAPDHPLRHEAYGCRWIGETTCDNIGAHKLEEYRRRLDHLWEAELKFDPYPEHIVAHHVHKFPLIPFNGAADGALIDGIDRIHDLARIADPLATGREVGLIRRIANSLLGCMRACSRDRHRYPPVPPVTPRPVTKDVPHVPLPVNRRPNKATRDRTHVPEIKLIEAWMVLTPLEVCQGAGSSTQYEPWSSFHYDPRPIAF
ncbi:unnamed protein product [Linum trigynum]|uniref:Aminotransferase-like plant mobile domain-containing protein n=1 Tax=Linum trigynum TaxID=586398 RepID=A0AAV2EAG0_9ROSI